MCYTQQQHLTHHLFACVSTPFPKNTNQQVPVKDRPGHFVMTYNMDVRTERIDTLLGDIKQQPKDARYSPMGQWQQQEVLERSMANGRVPANAW